MAQTARGMSLAQLFDTFPDDDAARQWIEQVRWGGEPYCPHCGSYKIRPATHPRCNWRCGEKECRKRFNVRHGTAMEGTHLTYRQWAIATYLVASSPKGLSSIKLSEDLGVTQKTAWFLGHRIRTAFAQYYGEGNGSGGGMAGPVEVDEAYVGGLEKNKHRVKKLNAGRGTVGKQGVAGALDRSTNTIRARLIDDTTARTLTGFVRENASADARVYTDEAAAYQSLPRHQWVNHGRGHYVEGDCHVNGVESFWAMLKRAHKGVYHKMSPKHLQRYVDELAGRHNIRGSGPVLERMALVVAGLVGKRLTYGQLTAPTGRPSGARS